MGYNSLSLDLLTVVSILYLSTSTSTKENQMNKRLTSMEGLYRNGTMQIAGPSFTGKTDYKAVDELGAKRNADKYGANPALCESHTHLCDKASSGLGFVTSVKTLAQTINYKMTRPTGEKNKWLLIVRQCAPFKYEFEEFISNTQNGPCRKLRLKNKDAFIQYKPAGMSSADFEKKIGCKPTTNWWVWLGAMTELQRHYMQGANQFTDSYPALLKLAGEKDIGLGDAFKKSQWPPASKVKGSYSMLWKEKIPSEADAKAMTEALGVDEVEAQIKKQEDERQDTLSSYNADMIKKLAGPIINYAESLREYSKFTERQAAQKKNKGDKKTAKKGKVEKAPAIAGAIVRNMLEGVEEVTGTSMSDDPKLAEICARIQSWTEGAAESEKELKSNKLTRDLHLDEADEMLADLADLQDAFAGMAL
jgi:hypothetical protein